MAFTSTVWADNQIRQVQSALSEAGFFYGTADGQMGEETQSALRRYQIRNGLEVTGEVSTETLTALKVQKKETAEGAATDDEAQIASSVKSPDAFLSPKSKAPQTAVEPLRSQRGPAPDFSSEPNRLNPATGQSSNRLMEAQKRLIRLGYYRLAPNGSFGTEMETALLRFQHATHLQLTGELDADTQQALFNGPPTVPTKPFRDTQNRPSQRVLRGIWIQ